MRARPWRYGSSAKNAGLLSGEKDANRFAQVETWTNVPGFFDRLYHQSPVSPNMRYVPMRLKKRRSTAALHNVTAVPRAEILACVLECRRCSAAFASSGRSCSTLSNRPKNQIRILVGLRSKTSPNTYRQGCLCYSLPGQTRSARVRVRFPAILRAGLLTVLAL